MIFYSYKKFTTNPIKVKTIQSRMHVLLLRKSNNSTQPCCNWLNALY